MISIKLTLLLIALSSDLAFSKKYKMCDFAKELYIRHDVPIDEIYMHLCIGTSLHTKENNLENFLGIYAIGTQWWCGMDSPGGSCNVKCSDLLDDDIADDVACANKILSSHGLQGWQLTEAGCKSRYEKAAEACIDDRDMMNHLRFLVGLEIYDDPATTTTTTPTSEFLISTRKQSLEAVTEIQKKEKYDEDNHGFDFTIIITIAVFAVALVVAVIVLKREKIKRHLSPERSYEFENSLVI